MSRSPSDGTGEAVVHAVDLGLVDGRPTTPSHPSANSPPRVTLTSRAGDGDQLHHRPPGVAISQASTADADAGMCGGDSGVWSVVIEVARGCGSELVVVSGPAVRVSGDSVERVVGADVAGAVVVALCSLPHETGGARRTTDVHSRRVVMWRSSNRSGDASR
jgi:hypothetical protein